MNVFRFLMVLALAVWLGALIFVPLVAQSAFTALPTAHLAGIVVRSSLLKLHWIGFISGLLFLITSLLRNRTMLGRMHTFALSHVLVTVMLVLTAISQFRVIPRMDALRALAGEIALLPASSPVRIEFDSLHAWSTRIEGTVLVLGLVVLYLTVRSIAAPHA